MKVCDKCRGDVKTSLVSSIDGQVFDLCNNHYTEFLKFLEQSEEDSNEQPQKNSRGRPRKT